MPKAKPTPVSLANTYNVPTRHWNKWTDEAKGVFNKVYGQIVANQSTLVPTGAEVSPRAWQVICWNIMWLATDEVNNSIKAKT